MKKRKLIILFLMVQLFFVNTSIMSVNAETVSDQDFDVIVENNELYIEKYKGKVKHNLVIPNEINGVTVVGVGVGAFKDAGLTGSLEFGDKLKYVRESAFEGNHLESLQAEGLELVESKGFVDNKLQTMLAPKLKKVDWLAFHGNNLSDLKLDELEEIGPNGFSTNKIESVDLPMLKYLGNSAFSTNLIERINAPHLSHIESGAFWANRLKMIELNSLDYLGQNVFDYNIGQMEHLGYFPIHVKDERAVNLVDGDAMVVLNPNDQFILEQVDKMNLNENEKFLFLVNEKDEQYSFATAKDLNDYIYYCVGSTIVFMPGVYKEYKDVEKVYIIDHGHDLVHGDELKNQKVSLNVEPENYIYSYETDLVSKLVYHKNQMLEEGFSFGEFSFDLVHLVASNVDLKGVDLNQDNFKETIEGSDFYEYVLSNHSEEVLQELLSRVEKDDRKYSMATYMVHQDHDANMSSINQPLMKPGQPVNEKVSVKVEKKWHLAPLDKPIIKIDLVQNEKVIDTIELGQDDVWKYEWKDLDKANHLGQNYQYTVLEHELEFYRSEVHINNDYDFTIHNYYETSDPDKPIENKPEKPPVEPPVEEEITTESKEPTLPNTGVAVSYAGYGMATLGLILKVYFNKKELNK